MEFVQWCFQKLHDSQDGDLWTELVFYGGGVF